MVVAGDAIVDPNDLGFGSGTSSGAFESQAFVGFGGDFEMSSGTIRGSDAGIIDGRFSEANIGVWASRAQRVRISGGLIEGGSGAFGGFGSGLFSDAPAVFLDSVGDAVIDGGEFIGGCNLQVDPFGTLIAGHSVMVQSGRLTINGGVFRGGDILAAVEGNASDAVSGSAGLWVLNGGHVDINGGDFTQGDFGEMTGDFFSSITLWNGTINLRGGTLENFSLPQGGDLNVYATAFEVDGTPIEFDGPIHVLSPQATTVTAHFVGQAPETFTISEFTQGLISQNELDAVLLNWGDGNPPDFAAIPEPATAAVLALVAGLCRPRLRARGSNRRRESDRPRLTRGRA